MCQVREKNEKQNKTNPRIFVNFNFVNAYDGKEKVHTFSQKEKQLKMKFRTNSNEHCKEFYQGSLDVARNKSQSPIALEILTVERITNCLLQLQWEQPSRPHFRITQ